MKHLTQAEYDALVEARADRDRLARMVAAGQLDMLAKAQALALSAKLQCLVVEISLVPRTPLAMGNYEMAVSVRPRQERHR